VKRVFLVLLLVVLTGCGVRPTGIVWAGRAPVGLAKGPLLYFYRGGVLTPVQRMTGSAGTAEEAVRLLVQGPTAEEWSAGFATRLPALAADSVSVSDPVDGVITITLQVISAGGVLPGLDQLVCTAAGTTALAGGNRQTLAVRLAGYVTATARPCPVTQ